MPFGTGTFTQTGGTHTATSTLTVGVDSGGTGTYNLSGTGVLSANEESIGDSGRGSFNQSGGTNTVTGKLTLGNSSGVEGTYNLSGGALSADWETIGNSGTGTFAQTGGTNAITDSLSLGINSGSTGTYDLSGTGVLTANYERIGYSGTGTFTQTGGTNTANNLLVATKPGGTGTYNLSGAGELSAVREVIGNSGAGTFAQTGGTNTTNTLTIKANTTGSGLYNLHGGTLNAMTIVNNDQFNYSGGTLNGDFTNNAGATFTLSGAGTRTVNGDVTNNGTIKVTGATDGTTVLFTGDFLNNGLLDTDPARLEFFGDLTIGLDGSILASAGDQYVLHQNFVIDSPSAAGWTTAGADLIFTAGDHLFSFGGLDLAWDGLFLEAGAKLEFSATGTFYASVLSGLNVNSSGIIDNILAPGGFALFYDPVLNPGLSGVYEFSGGGSLSPVPVPGAVLLGVLGLGTAACRLRRKRAWEAGGR